MLPCPPINNLFSCLFILSYFLRHGPFLSLESEGQPLSPEIFLFPHITVLWIQAQVMTFNF